jgi:hypothetical protein
MYVYYWYALLKPRDWRAKKYQVVWRKNLLKLWTSDHLGIILDDSSLLLRLFHSFPLWISPFLATVEIDGKSWRGSLFKNYVQVVVLF